MEKNNGSNREKFAPRFDELRFIETLVTAHEIIIDHPFVDLHVGNMIAVRKWAGHIIDHRRFNTSADLV
ncbi:unnamed protein product [Dovyalis caffra]|uniref:Uncharacterized protein n=1 Tax=Dovyalis caffra TaxID=77055 RepID=A0AAV1S2V5_9ROSI|nr:unnamed protein product [Dovyalis caffra]